MACIRTTVCLAFAAMAVAAPLAAHEAAPVYDRVSLSASVEQEVPNDVLVAVLHAERAGGEQAGLADEVNRLTAAALERARNVPGIEVRTLGYNTWPQYDKQVLRGWRVRQTLRLESRDGKALSRLLGELQQTLALESVGYSVSREAREEAEASLIGRALAAFRARAELVSREMGRGGYRLVQIDVNTHDSTPQPMLMRGAAMAMDSASVAAPVLEAGNRTVTVGVSGSIELLPGN